MSIRIETVRTEDFSMDFFRFGSGDKTLVILPGLSVQSVMGAADAIAAAYQPIEENYTIYVFDRRAELPERYTIRDMARDTAAAFAALGLRKVCLFGASQGGMIALVLAIEYPELVGKMVLGSSSAHVQDAQYRVVESWIRLAEAGDREGLYLAFGREIYPPQFFEQCRDALIAAAATVTDAELRRFITLAEGIKDFNVSVRTRQKFGLNEMKGNRSNILVHLANIAIRTGRKLHFDPVTMRFINDPEANRLAEQPMRSPWSLM